MDYCAQLEAELEAIDDKLNILYDELYYEGGGSGVADEISELESVQRNYESLLAEYDC